jgi:hypothetical protein
VDLDAYAGLTRRRAAALKGEPIRTVMDRCGMGAKDDAKLKVGQDLGSDLAFSNWRRGRPIKLGLRYDHGQPGEIDLYPTARSTGPWKVAERGRRAGTSRGRRGRPGRSYGATSGKGTWTSTVAEMRRQFPKRAEQEIGRLFRNG